MKKTFFVMMIALVAFATAGAQEMRGHRGRHQMDPEKMVERRVNMLDKELALTAEQKAAITAIYTDEAKAMKAGMEADKAKAGKPDREAMKARHDEMKARQDEVNQKVAALLTAEQKVKFEQLKAHHPKGGPREGRGPRHGGKSGDSAQAKSDSGTDCCKAGTK